MGEKQRGYRNIVQMRQVVEDWVMSGESRSAYCRRFGLTVHVLNYWIQRISQDDDSEAVFRELTAPEEAPLGSDSCVRLLYPDGRVLEFVGEKSFKFLQTVLSW